MAFFEHHSNLLNIDLHYTLRILDVSKIWLFGYLTRFNLNQNGKLRMEQIHFVLGFRDYAIWVCSAPGELINGCL